MTDESPWKILTSRTVFEDNRQLKITAQTVELSGGRIVEPYYRIDTKPSCAVVATDREGAFIMLRQYKHGIGRVCLTFPGGRSEGQEDFTDAGARELLEETGYVADTWRSLGVFTIHANQHVGLVGFLRAENAVAVSLPDSGDLERMEVVVVTRSQAISALSDGQIGLLGDATALGLALAEGRFNQKRADSSDPRR